MGKYLTDGIKPTKKIAFNDILSMNFIDETQIFRLKCTFFTKKVVFVKIYKYVYTLKIN